MPAKRSIFPPFCWNATLCVWVGKKAVRELDRVSQLAGTSGFLRLAAESDAQPWVACRPSLLRHSSWHNRSFQVRRHRSASHERWRIPYYDGQTAVAVVRILNSYFIKMWALIMLPVHTLTLSPLGGASEMFSPGSSLEIYKPRTLSWSKVKSH